MAVSNIIGNLQDASDAAVTNHSPVFHNESQLPGRHWMAALASATSNDDAATAGILGEQATVMMLGQMITEGNDTVAVNSVMKVPTALVSCLMFGAGVFGNLLALFVLATSSAEQRKTLFYKLVAGLAVTDLLGTTATSPVVIAVYLNNFHWVGGDALCHYFSFAMIFAGFATMLIVCAMSVERYVCVRHPYIYHTRLSGTKFARLTLLMCWAVSLTIAALPLVGVGTNVKQYPLTWCFFDFLSREPSDVAFNYMYAIIALICVIVTFVCNLCVIYTLVTLRSRQSRLDASETNQGKRRARATSQRFAEVQMMIMLIGVTVVFTVCFAPLMIFVLICQTELQFNSRKWVLFLIRVASFNPILDPWVYILFRRELAWRIVKVGRWLLCLDPIYHPQHLQNSLLLKDPPEGGVMTNGSRIANEKPSNGACMDKPARRAWDDPYNPSCLAFCYQCLCLPPAPRPTHLVCKQFSLTSGHNNRSPSRKPFRTDQSLTHSPSKSPSRLLLKPSSPSEHLLLIRMADRAGSSRSVNSTL